MSYELKIDPKRRAGSRFIGKVRRELVSAAIDEKKANGKNQQQLAIALGVNRSVISRMLKGEANLTLRSIGELAWAMNREIQFSLKPKTIAAARNVRAGMAIPEEGHEHHPVPVREEDNMAFVRVNNSAGATLPATQEAAE